MKKLFTTMILFSSITFSQNIVPKLQYHSFHYSPNIPEQIVGITYANIMQDSSFQLSGSLLFSLSKIKKEQYYETITYNSAKYTYEDEERGSVKEYYTALIGANKSIAHNLWINFMIGVTYETSLIEFYDRFEILGEYGKYYVEGNNKLMPTFAAGLFYSITRKYLAGIHYVHAPRGLMLSIGVIF